MQGYKSLCAAVKICSTHTHTFTHTEQHFDQLICKVQPAELTEIKQKYRKILTVMLTTL